MTHASKGDSNAHYSVQGLDAGGIHVKDGYVASDELKQTVGQTSLRACDAADRGG